MSEIRIGLSYFRDLVSNPGLAVVLQERWKYTVYPACLTRKEV